MINVSNEFKAVISDQDKPPYFTAKASVTLADSTVLQLTDEHIVLNGVRIDDATSQSNRFQIGSVIINQATISINNIYDDFSDYDFTDAEIVLFIGLKLSETTEWISKGIFIADDFTQGSSVITITALDRMSKFDKPFKDVQTVFPTTAQLLLTDICNYCGVSLLTTAFSNSNYTINERPTDDAISCREIVSWIAQISGVFARCNNYGQLELKWYDYDSFNTNTYDGGEFDGSTPYASGDNIDGGNFINYASGDNIDGGDFISTKRYHHIYSLMDPVISTDDVVITGVRVVDSTEAANEVMFGTSGYVISIEGNKLIQSQSDAQQVASCVGLKIIGMRFRPMSLTAICDPSREAGDVAYVTDKKHNTYQMLITNQSFTLGKADKISCDAESPSRNSATRYSVETKAIVEARNAAENKITSYDLMVQQLNNLVAHSFGVYKTEVVLEDGSVVYYMHDKPTLAESMKIWKQTADAFAVSTDGGQTFTAGFDVNGNAVFNVLAAIGIHADWIKTGKLTSDDGSTLIDMAYGVANSDNISFIDNVQSGYPLSMPFNIDDNVSKINKVLLKYTQQSFRTYSTLASSGGGTTKTSSTSGSVNATVPYDAIGETYSSGSATVDTTGLGGQQGTTDGSSATSPHVHTFLTPPHTHQVNLPTHTHNFPIAHTHGLVIQGHSHEITLEDHIHQINLGIQEQAISNYAFDIYIDGVLKTSITNNSSNAQGIIDLTAYITTNGWHTIELRSTTLKRISAQLNIKSYIKS